MKHMRLNTYHILFGVLMVFCGIAFFTTAHAATLYLSPSSGTYTPGATFDVRVYVNSGGVAINSADGSISGTNLTITGVSKASLFTLWPSEPSVSGGVATFAGGLPSPGYTGTSGQLLTLHVRAGSAGTASLRIQSAHVLANDGSGTNVLTGSGSAAFTIQEGAPPAPGLPGVPSVSSPTHPNQDTWYGNPDPEIAWNRSANVDGFSMELDQAPDTTPDTISEGLTQTRSFTDLKDGIWYFHVRAHTEAGWGQAAHYMIRVDNTAPGAPTVVFEDELPLYKLYALVHITAADATSGIDHFDVFLDDGDVVVLTPEEAENYLLRGFALGGHHLRVRAVDRAGKTSEITVAFYMIEAPEKTPCDVAECPAQPAASLTIAGVAMRFTTVAWLLVVLCLVLLALLAFILIRFKKKTGSFRGLLPVHKQKKRR